MEDGPSADLGGDVAVALSSRFVESPSIPLPHLVPQLPLIFSSQVRRQTLSIPRGMLTPCSDGAHGS